MIKITTGVTTIKIKNARYQAFWYEPIEYPCNPGDQWARLRSRGSCHLLRDDLMAGVNDLEGLHKNYMTE